MSLVALGLLLAAIGLPQDPGPESSRAGVSPVLELLDVATDVVFDTIRPAGSVGDEHAAVFLIHGDAVTWLAAGADGHPVMRVIEDGESREGAEQQDVPSWLTYSPRPAVSGDVDGDGRLDLVVASVHGSELRLLRSGVDEMSNERGEQASGDGDHAWGPTLPVVGSLASLAWCDVLPAPGVELVVTRYGDDPRMSILLYGWTGHAWELRAEVRPDGPEKPRCTGVLDVDRDGRQDLVCFDAREGRGIVLLQTADGDFARPDVDSVISLCEGLGFTVGVVRDDLDGDGRVDLLVRGLTAPALALLDGRSARDVIPLDRPGGWPGDGGVGPGDMCIARACGDGRFEIVFPLLESGRLAVETSALDSSDRRYAEVAAREHPWAVGYLDFGGSTQPDLVVSGRDPGLTIVVR